MERYVKREMKSDGEICRERERWKDMLRERDEDRWRDMKRDGEICRERDSIM